MRHAIEVRRVNGRMAVARHIAVPLVIGENHNEVQLLLGQSRRTQTKRHAQTKRTPFQSIRKKGSHAQQSTESDAPLKEKNPSAWPNICGEKWPVDLRGSVFVRFFNAGADTL